MRKLFIKLRKSEKGATAIEYGLIAALVAVAIITGLTSLGTELNTTFGEIEGKLAGAVPATTP